MESGFDLVYFALKALLLPPGILILLLFFGIVLIRRHFELGWWLSALASVFLIAASMPAIGSGWLASLEIYPPLPAEDLPDGRAQAIVVLSADDDSAAEYGRSTVGPMTLARVRYGAVLSRRTHLPVLVTGGAAADPRRSMAREMAEVLTEDFGIRDVWIEGQARDTWENARLSAEVLKTKRIDRVYLVTHAWHMSRALSAFARTGVTAIPAPTAFRGPIRIDLKAFFPSAKSLLDTYFAAHEVVGKVFYDRPELFRIKDLLREAG